MPKKMVNLLTALTYVLQILLKFYGLRPQSVEIEPGTVIHFWAPSQYSKNRKIVGSSSFASREEAAGRDRAKPVLLLLHGFGATGVLTWLFQVIAFSREFSVFLPDLLFFGGSEAAGPDRSPARQAECLGRALRAAGVERCAAVVGCSYGGIVGARMAAAAGPVVAVERLVLSNSVLALTESMREEMLDRVGARSLPELVLPETIPGLKRFYRAVFHRRWWFPDWAYQHFLEAMFDRREDKAELLKALVIKDDEFVIPDFPQKIYIIAGEEDQLFDIETVKQTKAKLGDKATLYSVKNAGHLVHIERPNVYNRIVKTILETSL